MTDAQARVQVLIDDLVGRDIERGLGITAYHYHNGNLVVDAWAGVADARDGRPVPTWPTWSPPKPGGRWEFRTEVASQLIERAGSLPSP